jgi:hypothetical protein
MDELKPCSRRAMWNAVTELEDMALHQSVKKRLSAETLAIAIAAINEKATRNRRPAPENNPLTLEEIATAIQIVCENNGCPPDKDCTLGQDCNNCIKEWLAGVGKPEQEEK